MARDEAERTIVLTEEMADAINDEVELGRHQTYDDALNYVLTRGFAEIERARESQRKAAEAKKLRDERNALNAMLAMNPKLATDPEFLIKMAEKLGIKAPTVNATKVA